MSRLTEKNGKGVVLGRDKRGSGSVNWVGGDQRGQSTPPFSSQCSHRHCLRLKISETLGMRAADRKFQFGLFFLRSEGEELRDTPSLFHA